MKRTLTVASAFAMMTAHAYALTLKPDASVEIAGQRMSCPNEAIYLDTAIPSEGMYGPNGGIYLNPELLQFRPAIVQKFIFAHECAHQTAGANESAADCGAARRGARDGWLTNDGLNAVCRDMQGLFEDEEHPSGAARCANIRRCYAGAVPDAAITASSSSWPAKRQAFTAGARVPIAEKLRRAAGKWRDGFGG